MKKKNNKKEYKNIEPIDFMFNCSLKDLKEDIESLINKYGEDARIDFDADTRIFVDIQF